MPYRHGYRLSSQLRQSDPDHRAQLAADKPRQLSDMNAIEGFGRSDCENAGLDTQFALTEGFGISLDVKKR